jgi:long-chain acyl-CoA synthetase
MTTLHGTILGLARNRGERKSYSLQREAGGYRDIRAADYHRTTLRFSAYLKSKGIGQGDRVLLLSENGPEWTMAALAAMNLGAQVVPVASVASLLEVQNTVRDARPKLSIVSERLASSRQVQEFLAGEGGDFIAWDLQQDEPLNRWIAGLDPLELNDSYSSDETIFLIYTSGTTGSPKAVPISHQNILSNARAVLDLISASENDRLVSVLPLSHMFEFTGGFVTPTLIGAKITYVKSLKPEDLLQALQDTRATILIGVPLLFEVIARNLQGRIDSLPGPLPKVFAWFSELVRKQPKLGPILFYPVHKALGGHIRYFMAGGSKLQPKVFDFFRGIGITLLQGYGLTETSPVLTVTTLETAGPDHVGRPLAGVEVGIFDDQGGRLPDGQEGEIWARGPNVFKGYLNPEHTAGVFSGGWFRTGDLGSFGADGMLRITGRKKDLIVTAAGKNVYPEEIEATVLGSGLFLEASAFGLQDAAGHEKVALVLVPDRAKFPGLSLEEIGREASRKASELCRTLAEYKWPQRIEVWFEELPKTATRKVKKHEVRKLLLEGDSNHKAESVATGEGLDTSGALEAAIAQGITSISGLAPAAIRLTDSLTKDLGLDSLTFVELVSHVEKKFGSRIEGIEFAAIQTVQDLVTALQFASGPPGKPARVHFTEFEPWENSQVGWRLPRRLVNVLLRAYLRIRHRMVVEGLENVLDGGPYVFTPNHTSHFDLLSVAASVPAMYLHSTFAVAAKDYFFNRSWKALASRVFVNAIPFDRKGRVNESMAMCRSVLDLGGSLVIFPEGTRSPDGSLQDFKPGVARLLAGHGTARAVPVYIEGAHQIMPKGAGFPGPGLLRVRYGRPISFREAESDPESLRQVADRLRREVEALTRG